MTYDTNNVFAKILRGEIPADIVYEDDYALAFRDIAPAAPLHIVVIPKRAAVGFAQFMAEASNEERQGFFDAVHHIAVAQTQGRDFRLITNNGEEAGQTVHHFHMHILSGRPLGPLVADRYQD